MNRNVLGLLCMAAALVLLVGCGGKQEENGTELEKQVTGTEQKGREFFLPAEEDEELPVVTSEFSETKEYPELAAFLISYYQIPEEYASETRYYYNYVDLDDDGVQEIFALVVGEYTQVPFGDPALILSAQEDGTFGVVESFEGVRTPVTIAEHTTNGWHDIIYREYGRGAEDGYRICRYNIEGGYQTELSEVVSEKEPQAGNEILSNNLIDDMDKGNYLTLAPGTTDGQEKE